MSSYLVASYTKAPEVVLQNVSQARFESEAISRISTFHMKTDNSLYSLYRKVLTKRQRDQVNLQFTVVLVRVHFNVSVKRVDWSTL
jgi:hypothetical protein